MRNSITISILLAVCVSASAQTYKESHPEIQPKTDLRPTMTVLLYPEGQASGKGITENGVAITLGCHEDNGLRGEETMKESGSRSNIGEDARMDIYLPANCNGQMVIMTPGGGYKNVSTFNEGAYGSKWLTEHGIAVCVLKYRLPNTHYTVPLDDVQNAFRYCRYHAAEWGIRQIGVMGGSAGGHLSSLASVLYVDKVTRPDFAVLLYPRITLRRNEYCDTKENLLGKDKAWNDKVREHLNLLSYYSPDTHVTPETPPTFIVLSADDNSVPATNMIPYYSKLIENGVNTELHVYPAGGHGWGWSNEEIKGEGKDKFAHYRPEFETAIERWLSDQLKNAE